MVVEDDPAFHLPKLRVSFGFEACSPTRTATARHSLDANANTLLRTTRGSWITTTMLQVSDPFFGIQLAAFLAKSYHNTEFFDVKFCPYQPLDCDPVFAAVSKKHVSLPVTLSII